ncbi:hypothetical protein ACF3OH_07025 [Chryseomicrobium aureum]|uniref:hypothetical protein n=1 Tax=Chryseomicrobium aureum TaxID=1441723 RepID=UPI001957A851|nr:hypothetical protein [Chryseomicrobium aureum]MBM7705663.1 hypothetical protein [Chryseomicrobium aureum]
MRTTLSKSSSAKEEKRLAPDIPIVKDLVWKISGTEYTIKNVPAYEMNADGREFVDMKIVNLLSMVRNLMYADEIPHTVDFNDIADLV